MDFFDAAIIQAEDRIWAPEIDGRESGLPAGVVEILEADADAFACFGDLVRRALKHSQTQSSD